MSTNLPIGSYRDALALVGQSTKPVFAEVPIEIGHVKALAGLVEDPNPSYWSTEFANATWGTPIAPPATLICLFTSLHWHPEGLHERTVLCASIPLPGSSLINSATDTTFHRPLRVGDWLNVVETLTAISEEKDTKLGRGHFVTTVASYRNQDGVLIAESENIMLRFTPHAEVDLV